MDILITGCSTGFGEVIAKTLARAGHRVFATMRDVEGRNAGPAAALQDWASSEDHDLHVLEMDVTDDASVAAAMEAVDSLGGALDVVVNNAGVASGGPLEAYDMQQVRDLYEVNVFGPLRVDKAVLPGMRARRSGLIIHVSSTLGRVLPHRGGLYPASKWALEGLAESLAYDVRRFGIDVVILEPGAFPTTATSRGIRARNEDIVREYAAAAPPPAARAAPAGEAAPQPNIQEVADEVKRLIDLPPGRRPLRSVVGPIFTEGVAEYNREYERVRDQLNEVLKRPDQAVTWVQRPPR